MISVHVLHLGKGNNFLVDGKQFRAEVVHKRYHMIQFSWYRVGTNRNDSLIQISPAQHVFVLSTRHFLTGIRRSEQLIASVIENSLLRRSQFDT